MTKIEGWAAWHPKHGFKVRYGYQGPVAYLTLDDAVEQVREENKENGTNNRTGWRAVRVEVVKVDP